MKRTSSFLHSQKTLYPGKIWQKKTDHCTKSSRLLYCNYEDHYKIWKFKIIFAQKGRKHEENRKYRDSPVSAVFWSPANRTIGKTALIGHWFSTKIAIWDLWIFKVPFFAHFHYWNLTRFFLFWTKFSETKLKLKSNGS